MKKTLIVLGVVVILVFAGYGSVWTFKYINFKNLQNRCYQKIKNADNVITAYFASKSDFSKIQTIATDLQSQQGVNSVSTKSSEELLQDFIRMHTGDQFILERLKQLPSNPLEPYISLNLNDNQDVFSTISYINGEAQKYGIVVDSLQETTSMKQKALEFILRLQDDPTTIVQLQYCVNATSTILPNILKF